MEFAGAELPANPVHHCTKKNDGSDDTDWSYVYFGSYPQTEVTGDALTSAITGAAYDSHGDAWVNGTKYRRIQRSDANHSHTGDGYFSWNGDNDYRYFKWERIKWRVLENNGSTLFVAADKGLDCESYDDIGKSITWENSTLRSWLNNDFYRTAFSSREQDAIVEQNIVNEDNFYYGTKGGNDTRDKVYLLSHGELTNPGYGFCRDYATYSASRRMQPSDYAHAMGVSVSTSSSYKGSCGWWLRSPGDTYCAVIIYANGSATGDSYVDAGNNACVPALQINLSSDLWFAVDDGSSGEGGGNETEATYTVAFDSRGGSEVEGQSVEAGGNALKPADPAREGYTFAGWHTDASCTEPYDFEGKVTGSITLYAKWTEDSGGDIKDNVDNDKTENDSNPDKPDDSDVPDVSNTPDSSINALFNLTGKPVEQENEAVSAYAVLSAVKKITIGKGEPFQAEARVMPADATDKELSYQASNQKVAVSGDGTVTGKKTGTSWLIISSKGNTQAKAARIQVQVKKAPKKITLNAKQKKLKKGKTFKIKVKLPEGSASHKITFSSNKPSVARVSSDGKVFAVKKGSATITAKTFNGKKAKLKIIVQ